MNSPLKFSLGSICFEIAGDTDTWFSFLKPLLTPNASPQGAAEFKKITGDFSIPSGAVRAHYNNDRQEQEFQHENGYLYLRPAFAVRLYPAQNRVVLEYREMSETVLAQTGHILRWLLKHLGLQKSLLYLPGELVLFQNHPVLISGHPECGKTLFSSLLKANAADLIAPSILIDCERNVLSLPFGFAAKPHEDSELKKIWRKKNTPLPARPKETLDGFFLIQEWEDESSECVPLSKEEAVSTITALSRRGYEYCFTAFSMDQEMKLKETLKGISLFRFFIGKNQKLAAKTLEKSAAALGK